MSVPLHLLMLRRELFFSCCTAMTHTIIASPAYIILLHELGSMPLLTLKTSAETPRY